MTLLNKWGWISLSQEMSDVVFNLCINLIVFADLWYCHEPLPFKMLSCGEGTRVKGGDLSFIRQQKNLFLFLLSRKNRRSVPCCDWSTRQQCGVDFKATYSVFNVSSVSFTSLTRSSLVSLLAWAQTFQFLRKCKMCVCVFQVCYTEGKYIQVRVHSEVFDPLTRQHKTTNVFHFTFISDRDVPSIVPKTYGGKRTLGCVFVWLKHICGCDLSLLFFCVQQNQCCTWMERDTLTRLWDTECNMSTARQSLYISYQKRAHAIYVLRFNKVYVTFISLLFCLHTHHMEAWLCYLTLLTYLISGVF